MSVIPENLMAASMRWFGPTDPVALAELRQTGAEAVFTALHDVRYGETWPAARIAERRDEIARAGLAWRVVESVPVHESIKTRTGDFVRHIANYAATIETLGVAGIKAIIYNFMPVFDWVRTDLDYPLADGSETLRFDPVKFAAFEIHALGRKGAEKDFDPATREAAAAWWKSISATERESFIRQTLDLFPGVRLGLTLDDLREMLAAYREIDAARLKQHLKLFLGAVVPVAERAGVRLALHPDDPPFSVLGLPRIVSTEADLRDVVAMVDSPANGLCYCTGSLGTRGDNDLPGIVRRLGPWIHAAHLRSVQREADGSFYEAHHLGGSVDLPAIVRALLEEQAARRRMGRSDWQILFRPDHGRTVLDDFKRPEPACPGYPLIGRALALAELRGLQIGISRQLATG
jgi:mannonate dehydratase